MSSETSRNPAHSVFTVPMWKNRFTTSPKAPKIIQSLIIGYTPMHMFKEKSENGSATSNSVETIIGPSVKLEGEFKSDGDVVVEGIVNGTLKTKGALRVGEDATIKANVTATSAIIAGTVDGNLTIKAKLELGPRAHIAGDITCSTMAVAEGAVINGAVSIGKGDEPREHLSAQATQTTS